MRRSPLLLCILGLAALGAVPAVAQHEGCDIYGTIMAEPNVIHPEHGAWMYRMIVHWNTGSQYGLSHFDLLLDSLDGNCDCQDFADAIVFDYPVGSTTGQPVPCTLSYWYELNCGGDPSIGVPGIMFKFEPYEDEDCEPGPYGTGTFTFYSDLAPGHIADDNLFLIEKYSLYYCYGHIEGDFPNLPCDPVPTESGSWGAVKSLYR